MSLRIVNKGKSKIYYRPKNLQNGMKLKQYKKESSKQIIQAVPMLWRKLFSCIALNSMQTVQRHWEEVVVVGERGFVHEAVGDGDGNRS